MRFFDAVYRSLITHFNSKEIYPALIIAVLSVVSVLALYEFIVYKVVLHRSLYNKAFNICIALIPYFVSTIILCLQSNLIITLGTIGALAIIRFRTAVKDPVDMIFIFWAIHIGISCGCQLYELAIITSIVVTIVLVILNYITFGNKSHILIIRVPRTDVYNSVIGEIKKHTKKFRIKSRNYTGTGLNVVIELVSKEADLITENISKISDVESFSLMEYDVEDIL